MAINTISLKKTTASAAMPRRKSHSDAMMLLTVAVASPGTISVVRTYPNEKPLQTTIRRYRNPASRAMATGERSAVRFVSFMFPSVAAVDCIGLLLS
jgi:hypothetical protein